MSSRKRSNDRKRFIDAARNGQLEEVIKLSSKFSNDVEVLGEALIRSCLYNHSRERSIDSERFIDAARNGQLEEVIKLSSKFINDVEVLSEALIMSCFYGHLDVVKWLRGHTAADVNYNMLWSPLTAACDNDHLDIVKYLVETCHADVNLPDRGGYTSLTQACYCVSMSVSMYLLCEVSDLDVNIADRDGDTALHWAVWCSKDRYAQLHWACSYRGDVTEVLSLVYVKGHKINAQNNYGDTPLHLACSKGHSDIVETLMLAGADETITNDRGKTPAQVAKSEGHSELLKLLDRDSLWQVMLGRRNKLKLSVVVLMMLTARLMRQRQMIRRWCHTLTVVHVMLTIRSIINFNRR